MLVETEEGRVPDAIFVSREITHHCCFSSIHYLAFWLMFVIGFSATESFNVEPFRATEASSPDLRRLSTHISHETTS
jgi:hypothetical protein